MEIKSTTRHEQETYRPPIGQFVRPCKVSYQGREVIFWCRPITVGEHTDLVDFYIEDGRVLANQQLPTMLCHLAIIHWQYLAITDDDDQIVLDENGLGQYLAFDKEYISMIPKEVLDAVGLFIYGEMMVLSDELIQKYKGHIRYLYALDDKSGSSQSVYLKDCKKCLEAGRDKLFKCGYSEEKKSLLLLNGDIQYGEEGQPIEVAVPKEKDEPKDLLSRYANRSRFNRGPAKVEPERPSSIRFGGFEYPECPVSWVPTSVKNIASKLYDAQKNNMPIFDGGIFSQPNHLYTAAKVVESEYTMIENELKEKEMDKHKRKK